MTDEKPPAADPEAALTMHEQLLAIAAEPPSLEGAPIPDLVKGRYETVRVSDIYHDPENPREHITGIDEMAESIKEQGLLQTILVRRKGRKLLIVEGHRRHAAVVKLGWEFLTVEIEQRGMDDIAALEAALTTSTQRSQLDPIEEARAIRKIMHGRKIANYREIAPRFGRSEAWVRGRITLIDHLSTPEQEEVRMGTLRLTDAWSIIKAREDAERREARGGGGGGGGSSFRKPGGGGSGGGKVSKSKGQGDSWFGEQHFLADKARLYCRTQHPNKIKVAPEYVACGVCWEAVIRRDALLQSEGKGSAAVVRATPEVDGNTIAVARAKKALGG